MITFYFQVQKGQVSKGSLRRFVSALGRVDVGIGPFEALVSEGFPPRPRRKRKRKRQARPWGGWCEFVGPERDKWGKGGFRGPPQNGGFPGGFP